MGTKTPRKNKSNVGLQKSAFHNASLFLDEPHFGPCNHAECCQKGAGSGSDEEEFITQGTLLRQTDPGIVGGGGRGLKKMRSYQTLPIDDKAQSRQGSNRRKMLFGSTRRVTEAQDSNIGSYDSSDESSESDHFAQLLEDDANKVKKKKRQSIFVSVPRNLVFEIQGTEEDKKGELGEELPL